MLLNVIQCEVNSISVMFIPKMFHLNLIDPLDISSGSQKMQGINQIKESHKEKIRHSQNEGHSTGQLTDLFKKSMSGGKNRGHVLNETKETQ